MATTNRAANATIKGYLYQFDLAIVQLLSAQSLNAAIVIEGIEDVDFSDENGVELTQCKYYEGTEYNHSVIKDAVIHLVRHYHGAGGGANFSYKIYGHYKSGQTKLPDPITVDFLKANFLTYTSKNKTHEVHVDLSLSDSQLSAFIGLLTININAISFDQQQSNIEKLLVSHINGCSKSDALDFFYPLAATTIQQLAIQKNEAERKISKTEFIDKINKKDATFSRWMALLHGEKYYANLLRKKYFPSRSNKIFKAARIFIIDASGELDIPKIAALLGRIVSRFSHTEHKRTPSEDRFCPFVLLQGVSDNNLVEVKEKLLSSGVNISDGHAFKGAKFSPARLADWPTKDNPVKINLIGCLEQLDSVISEIKNVAIEVFEFHKDSQISSAAIKSQIIHHRIRIDSISLIAEVI